MSGQQPAAGEICAGEEDWVNFRCPRRLQQRFCVFTNQLKIAAPDVNFIRLKAESLCHRVGASIPGDFTLACRLKRLIREAEEPKR
ncbi:MAG: hypothetical protein WA571_13180, partial [Candidatus Binatus sp.]